MKKIDKKKLVSHIVSQLERDLEALRAAALETYAAATNEESKPENKYDTRALEASYLAGAQAKRVLDIEASLTIYKFLELKEFTHNSMVESTALVEIDLEGRRSVVFIVPARGSLTVKFETHTIQVITPVSPLGEALVGLKAGDTATVEKPDEVLEYEIISVF
ncbi:MAG: GreA/GreB family elongation factor [Bdellovibrionales bacterium]|nr:GreA/GreB family elongation factor [Bdellovibrionales bacterium]